MSESADITFQDTLNQWKLAPSKFAANYYTTKIEIGETYVREFKKSFDLKKIPGTGRYWRNRKRDYPHPILNETGTLKESITYSLLEGSGLQIYTDETKFPVGAEARVTQLFITHRTIPIHLIYNVNL